MRHQYTYMIDMLQNQYFSQPSDTDHAGRDEYEGLRASWGIQQHLK